MTRLVRGSECAVRGAGIVLAALVLALVPARANADLIHLKNGRVLSVESWQVQGEIAVLVLRDGGRMEAPQSLIEDVFPDEYERVKPAPLTQEPEEVAPEATNDIPSLVNQVAARYGIDARLAHAVVRVESNYQPNAVSPKGAKGLMQLMPATARQYAVDDPFDPASNLEAGMRHLRGLLDRFKNDVGVALAAYNAGLLNVTKYGGIPPFRETQDYVRRIMALTR